MQRHQFWPLRLSFARNSNKLYSDTCVGGELDALTQQPTRSVSLCEFARILRSDYLVRAHLPFHRPKTRLRIPKRAQPVRARAKVAVDLVITGWRSSQSDTAPLGDA